MLTFNEWTESTSVESATQWASSSGYGSYLDALHVATGFASPQAQAGATIAPNATAPARPGHGGSGAPPADFPFGHL